jgi:hypothetical protein
MLKMKRETKLRILLSHLKKLGLLSVFEMRNRKRYYRLLDLTTWGILQAGGVKNLSALRQGRYHNLIAKFLRALIAKHRDSLVSAVVYGSVARGCATPQSDVDMLIVSQAFSGSVSRRIDQLVKLGRTWYVQAEEKWLRDHNVYARVSCYPLTPHEARYFRLLYLDMTRDAIILLDQGDFFKQVLTQIEAKLDRLGAQFVQLDKKWYWRLKPKVRPGEAMKL